MSKIAQRFNPLIVIGAVATAFLLGGMFAGGRSIATAAPPAASVAASPMPTVEPTTLPAPAVVATSDPTVWVAPTPVPEWDLPAFNHVLVKGIGDPNGQKISDAADDELTSILRYDAEAPDLIFEDTDGVLGVKENDKVPLRSMRWRICVGDYKFRGAFTATWNNDPDAFGRGLLREWKARYAQKYRAPIAAAMAGLRTERNATATGGSTPSAGTGRKK